ncbi:hypothetical protein M2427_005751 [Bradyrhizobium sp. BR13661]|nr:hypothetical protein [Bradyrhizobium sp. BR13661]
MANQGEAPIASEAVRRIDMLFEIERSINGKRPRCGLASVVNDRGRSLPNSKSGCANSERCSTNNDTAKTINYGLNRWTPFTRFLTDDHVGLSNNAAERALRGIAIGRKNWTFAGSDTGSDRAAAIYTWIETCKMNDVNPQAWLTVLARLPDHPASQVAELLPWTWKAAQQSTTAAAA